MRDIIRTCANSDTGRTPENRLASLIHSTELTEDFMYDMKNLAKLKTLEANAPDGWKGFVAFDKAAMAAGRCR